MNCEKILQPKDLDIEVGQLSIRTKESNASILVGYGIDVKVNGKPIKCRSLTLRIAVGEIVTATVEFCP